MARKDKMKGIWRGLTYVPREQRLAEMEEDRQSKLLAQQHKQAMEAERLQQEGRAKELRTLADLGVGPRGMGVKDASVKAGMGKVSGVGTGGASATQVMKLFNDIFTNADAKWAWENKLPKNDKDQFVDASGKALNQKQVDTAWRKFALEQTMAVKNTLMGESVTTDVPKAQRPIFEGVGKHGERLFTNLPELYSGQELKPYGQALSQKAGIGGGAQKFIDEISPPPAVPETKKPVAKTKDKTPWWAMGKSINPMDLAMRMGATLGQDLWRGIEASKTPPSSAPAPALTTQRQQGLPLKQSTKRRVTAETIAPQVASLPLSTEQRRQQAFEGIRTGGRKQITGAWSGLTSKVRSVLRKPEEETKRPWYATGY